MSEKKFEANLTIWERLQLMQAVLPMSKSVKDMLRSDALRHVLSPDIEERKLYDIEKVSPGSWKYPEGDGVVKLMSSETEKPVQLLSSDLDYITDCFELMYRREQVPNTEAWSCLVHKFYTDEDLEELAEKLDKEKK